MSQLFDDRIPITPSTFDLIVIGTGLPGSVIAAAASTAGKAVLHLDTNHFYGGHFASLPLDDLFPFLNSHASPPSSSSTTTTTTSSTITGHDDYTALPLTRRLFYSDIETVTYAPQALAQHNPKRFYIDLSGPKVLFLADKAADLLRRSGVSSFLCFKGIEMQSVYDDTGELWNVPDSRVAIFKDKRLSLMEKNKLMRFFKLVWQHLEAASDEQGSEGNSESRKISDEDLESPFVDYLNRMELPHKIKSIILYAIAMVDYDQDNLEACKSILKTRDGIERLAVFYKSRFAQRVPVAVLMDKDSGQYKGVRLASGQNLFSDQLVMDPTFKVPSLPVSSPPDVRGSPQVLSLKDDKRKVARGICITSSSLKPDISNCLLVYPPRSLYPEQDASIRAIQIGGSSAEVCPKGMTPNKGKCCYVMP
ncbi:rab proteins geranylgeranyltransferase component A-like [Pyrus ussuriensis x Pyrus communis]|uniref:Rab proteins geranylgeranyltransferase component A-like n=1 Tax=Pyrus ussuriensis x Pyrus communis TaxID=2448454 RepID=A0A5N5GAA6_9ROSA|nr:rab proteins geranylgeranyltransferase component A-like [Pyrus ussuriensis x Pyrus communis]